MSKNYDTTLSFKTRPLVAIVGPTGSGKSQLAIELADYFKTEIICADSISAYRGFNIGAAKPSLSDQARIRHHLLDVIQPTENFNVAMFQRLASQAIADIRSRQKVPFLVGGGGLYIDSILYDYNFLPPATRIRHDQLQKMSLIQLLKEVDRLGLKTASIDFHNPRRVIRLIETNGLQLGRPKLKSGSLIIGLEETKQGQKEKIERRIDQMIDQGLEAEVRHLANVYGWSVRPMQSIGYREWRDYFEAKQSYADTRSAIIQSSLRLAKKQSTWFKRNKSTHWLSPETKFEQSVDYITTYLNK